MIDTPSGNVNCSSRSELRAFWAKTVVLIVNVRAVSEIKRSPRESFCCRYRMDRGKMEIQSSFVRNPLGFGRLLAADTPQPAAADNSMVRLVADDLASVC